MKKAELKPGVAYYATSRNNGMETWHDSWFKTHNQHRTNRHYVIFEADGQPKTGYRSPSVIFMTTCPTYGTDCPTHRPREGYSGIACHKTDFRLMDIRDEYWTVIKRMQQRRKERPSKDIRAERLVRIAKRQKQQVEKPIIEEFYSVLQQITGSRWGHHSTTTLGNFSVEEKQKITQYLKAGMAIEIRVAS
jgi:hypothetical protein